MQDMALFHKRQIRCQMKKTKKVKKPTIAELSPPNPITIDGMSGYTYGQLRDFMTPKEYEKFTQWMSGQTCMLIPGTKELLIYQEDVTRFLAMVRHNVPTYFD